MDARCGLWSRFSSHRGVHLDASGRHEVAGQSVRGTLLRRPERRERCQPGRNRCGGQDAYGAGTVARRSLVAGVGWSDLGVLGGSLSEAAGVSANGKVVVGWSSQESSSNFHAFRWTPERGMEDLNLVYAPLLQGIELETATAVSPDGRFIVGACASYPAIDFRLTCWTPARRRMWKCRAVWNWMEWICRRPCLANRHSGTSPAQAEHAGTAVCRHAGKRRYVHPDHPAERNMGHIGDGAALSATYYQQGARLW